jgi:hypothetical protein
MTPRQRDHAGQGAIETGAVTIDKGAESKHNEQEGWKATETGAENGRS